MKKTIEERESEAVVKMLEKGKKPSKFGMRLNSYVVGRLVAEGHIKPKKKARKM